MISLSEAMARAAVAMDDRIALDLGRSRQTLEARGLSPDVVADCLVELEVEARVQRNGFLSDVERELRGWLKEEPPHASP